MASMSDIADLSAHREKLQAKADEIIGIAMVLRGKLKSVVSEPLPDAELDVLVEALNGFIKAAEGMKR